MKRRFFLTVAVAVAGILSLVAQTTAMVPYEGGYFVKNGNEWTEYRPADKTGKWSTYKQYKEDDTFFYMKNKACRLAIPKLGSDKIHIDREKKGKWEIVYNTIDVHYQCVTPDGLFYCYQDGRGREHNGYYVRCGNGVWLEYAPGKKRGVWAEFKQTGENKDYFIVESTKNVVHIPKKSHLNFVITSHEHPGWKGGYTTKAIYDRSATYPFSFYYQEVLGSGKKVAPAEKGARISLDNRCNLQVAFGGKHYDFVYSSIDLMPLADSNEEVIVITIDKKNRVVITSGGGCTVECKKIGKNVTFLGASDKLYNQIAEQLRMGTFNL